MRNLSIRWRLTLWYGSVLAVLVAGFGGAVYVLMSRHILVRIESELHEELAEFTVEVQLAKSRADLFEQLRNRFYHHENFEFQLADAAGRLLWTSAKLEPLPAAQAKALEIPPGENSTEILLAELGEYQVLGRKVSGPAGDYLIQALVPLDEHEDTELALLQVLLTAGPLVVAVGLIGGYWLARRALSPVNRMALSAEKITAARLNQRIEVPGAADELSHLAKTFNRMFDRLEASFDQMRRFSADAAHELRTPLAVLRTEVEVALRTGRSTAEYEQALGVVLSECDRLGRLTDQLLVLCRHDGSAPFRTEEVQLDALVRDVVERLRGAAEFKDQVLLIKEFPPAVVLGDDTQMSQLFFNVLDNAIKYSPREGTITIAGRRHGSRLVVDVVDSGPGITLEHLPHVFERFYRVDAGRDQRAGGTGLGLAICKAIVESAGGQIQMLSSPGQGATVRIELPLVDARENA